MWPSRSQVVPAGPCVAERVGSGILCAKERGGQCNHADVGGRRARVRNGCRKKCTHSAGSGPEPRSVPAPSFARLLALPSPTKAEPQRRRSAAAAHRALKEVPLPSPNSGVSELGLNWYMRPNLSTTQALRTREAGCLIGAPLVFAWCTRLALCVSRAVLCAVGHHEAPGTTIAAGAA